MTTQEKLDRLLKYLNELTAYQGAGVILDPAQAEKAQRVCEFANISELAFYVRFQIIRPSRACGFPLCR